MLAVASQAGSRRPILQFSAVAITLILGGCGDGSVHPFGKPDGQLAGSPPPSEDYARAGPGAERQIDYETLYGSNRSAQISEAVSEQSIDAARAAPEPKAPVADSKLNIRQKIAAVAVPP